MNHQRNHLGDGLVQLSSTGTTNRPKLDRTDICAVEFRRLERGPVVGCGEVLLALNVLVESLHEVLVVGYGVKDTDELAVGSGADESEQLSFRLFVVERFGCAERFE